jgi:hypothetical protein
MDTIEWRQVPGFPRYEIGSDGSLRTWIRRERKWRDPCDDKRPAPQMISGTTTPLGYRAYILRKEVRGKPYRRTAHRLVALAFLPNPDNLPDVAHNDGDPGNNHVTNLRWSTHRDNQMDMRRHGTMQDGEKCVTAKLTAQQVADIRRLHDGKYGTGRRLAREYGVSPACISRIKHGGGWHGVG